MESGYAIVRKCPDLGFADAVTAITEALESEGFGVLTEIDVAATLKKKLGVDFRRYLILGACNPVFAHKALSEEPMIGVLLPCNVVVTEGEEGGCILAAFKPTAGFSLIENPAFGPIAEEVEERVRRAVESVG